MKEGNVLVQCRFDLTDSEIAAAARKRAALEVEIALVRYGADVGWEKGSQEESRTCASRVADR